MAQVLKTAKGNYVAVAHVIRWSFRTEVAKDGQPEKSGWVVELTNGRSDWLDSWYDAPGRLEKAVGYIQPDDGSGKNGQKQK